MSRIVYRPFFRLTQADPPTLSDFTSRAAQGAAPMDDDPDRQRLHSGISVFATETQARKKASQYPFLGNFIARIELPDDAPVVIERTLRNGPGHHTIWGDPALLCGYVTAVVPV
jgi:hypothetical protein